MLTLAPLFFIFALLCYVIISLYFVRSLFRAANYLTDKQEENRHKYRIHRAYSIAILILGLIFHALSLYQNMFIDDTGVIFSLFNVLSLTSWLMLLFSVIFTSYRPIIVLNVLAAPVAAVGLILGYIGSLPHALPNEVTDISKISWTMELHILSSIAAYSVFLMAALQALLLKLQNRELKHKTKTRVWVALLPALQTMEKLLFDMLVLGFGLLSLALLLGWFGVTDFFAQHLAHKTVFSGLAWLIFAWLIFGHWKYGWRGKRAVNMTLWGFGFLVLGFIGTKFVLQILLS